MNIQNIDKYYKYARSIAKELGEDLLHHVIINLQGKKITHLDAYIYRAMRNEWVNPKSSFNKLYKSQEDIIEYSDSTVRYDSILLHKILLELETEGYGVEVDVFKDCYLASSVNDVAIRTKTNHRTIIKICNFVKNEIICRYKQLDNQ